MRGSQTEPMQEMSFILQEQRLPSPTGGITSCFSFTKEKLLWRGTEKHIL